jgi:hypothetical protein
MGRYDTGYRKVRWVLELLRDWSLRRGPPLNQSKHDAHNTVGIPTIYQIEKFDKFEYEGPTVGPAKMIRDAKN